MSVAPTVEQPLFAAATDAMLRASRAVVGIAARSLPEGADITLVQLRALVLLDGHGQLNAGKLAELLGVSPSTVTGLCDRLAAKDLIVRAQPLGNRREVVVRLAPSGQTLVETATSARRRALARVLERVPVEMLDGMVEALTAFAEAAGESPLPAWAAGWRA